MFCGWAFQAAEIRCEKNETNTYWNGLNKLVTDEFTSGETVLHEGSLNEGRFSAFRGYQLTEALAIALTFELEIFSTLDTICFPIKLYWWFSWIFFNSKHLTHFKCLHVWLRTEVKGWTAIIYLALTTFSSGYKHSFYESSDSGQRQIQLRLLAEVGKKGWF